MATRETAPVHFGEPHHTWCPKCRLNTVANTPIYALATAGPYCIGEWSLCSECGHSPYSDASTALTRHDQEHGMYEEGK